MQRAVKHGFALLGLAYALATAVCPAAQPPRKIEDTYADHTRAVEMARAGRYDEGLAILRRLLRSFPDDYPLNRDFILISSWKGDCAGALERFERVRRQPRFEPYFTGPVADCAVKQARDGRHDQALAVLEELARRDPENYPLQRDIIVITTWKGDCPAALERYERVRGRAVPEPYFAIPVADCLLDAERPREAAALVRSALETTPGDERLRHALMKAQLALPLAASLDHPYREFVFDFRADESDQGLLEYWTRAEVSARLARHTRVYARYLRARADDRALAAGDLDRAGLGLRHGFDESWHADVEVSTDIGHGDQAGAGASVVYELRDTWRFLLGYTSFAEDLPLLARANDIEATRWDGSAEYFSLDHRWYGRATVNSYDFSDGNQRDSFYATVGYAYERRPYREQHLYGEWYQSRNTRTDAPYFNPLKDRSLGLVHRTDFIYESRYQRHVDSLYLTLAAYDQDDFGTHGEWRVSYEQNYDFDDFNAFSWEAGYARNVYDGGPEYEALVALRYLRRF
jgi:tetratricopeptide (TPR) repeat protein